jgi:hypothetical protein
LLNPAFVLMLAGCIPAGGGSADLQSSIPSRNNIFQELPEDGEYHSPETYRSWVPQRQLQSRCGQSFIEGNSGMGKCRLGAAAAGSLAWAPIC